MAKTYGQKLKVLYLMRLLTERSDEAHPLSMNDILQAMEEYGIKAERKSIYDDIAVLREYGLEINYQKVKPEGYYLETRDFELVEIKLLIDSVISSKFITVNKTKSLVEKLVALCSCHEAGLMQREIFVPGRIKSMNESIYYNIDLIHEAISQKRQLSFKYITYTKDKNKSFRHGGKRYRVSPFALLRDNENYYLVAYDAATESVKHYRVDRMDRLSPMELPREGESAYRSLDLGSYTTETFSMFSGQEQKVCLRFSDELLDVAFDRFGKNINLMSAEDGFFKFWVSVVVSPQFYAWIFALAGKVVIVEPTSIRDGMMKHVRMFMKEQFELDSLESDNSEEDSLISGSQLQVVDVRNDEYFTDLQVN